MTAHVVGDEDDDGPVVEVTPLWNPDFRRLFVGQSFSAVGDSMVPLALAFAVLDLTQSASALGLVILASRLPVIVFVVLGGTIGDRVSRSTVMIAADWARCAVQLLGGVLLVFGHATPWLLGVLVAMTGTASAFFQPASTGLVPAIAPPDALQRANAILGISRSATNLAAIAASGLLVAFVGPGWVFIIDGATFAVSAVALMGLRVATPASPTSPAPVIKAVRAGWTELRGISWLLPSIVHVAAMNLVVIAPFIVLGPFIAERELSGPTSWATIATAGAVGGLVGNLVAARWAPGRPLVAMYLATLLVAPLMVLMAIPAPTPVLAVAAALGLAQNTFFNAMHTTLIQRSVPDRALSTVSSMSMLGSLIAAPIGLAAAGPATDRVGTSTVLIFGGIWTIATGLVMAAVESTRSQSRTHSTPEPARPD